MTLTYRSETETSENGTLPSDNVKTIDKSVEDQGRNPSDSPTDHGARLSKGLTIKYDTFPSGDDVKEFTYALM